MPKFLLPIFVLTLVSLSSFGFVVWKLGPSQTSSVILFLITLFLGLTFILSLIFFFVHKKFFFKPQAFDAFGPVVSDDDLRSIFRTSLRNAFLTSLLLTTLLILWRFL